MTIAYDTYVEDNRIALAVSALKNASAPKQVDKKAAYDLLVSKKFPIPCPAHNVYDLNDLRGLAISLGVKDYGYITMPEVEL
jgi:hypothetical protein